MALKPEDKRAFRDLCRAAAVNHLTLIESTDAATGEYRAVLAIVLWNGTDYEITPLGHLCPGDPMETYTDPGLALARGDALGGGGQ